MFLFKRIQCDCLIREINLCNLVRYDLCPNICCINTFIFHSKLKSAADGAHELGLSELELTVCVSKGCMSMVCVCVLVVHPSAIANNPSATAQLYVIKFNSKT